MIFAFFCKIRHPSKISPHFRTKTDNDVSNAPRTGFLDKKYSLTIAISQDMDRRPMIQQEINLEENQNIIRNFIYDDVPQEQYIIVIE